VTVTPHHGATTAEANDRAGFQAAEQIVAALTGGSVTTAVNIPAIPEDDLEALAPFVPLSRALGKIAVTLLDASSFDELTTEFLGGLADRDTRLLAIEALIGALRGHTEEEINAVNAPALADQRGITLRTETNNVARDYTDLIRVTVRCGEESVRVVGTVIGGQHRPHLLEAWGQRFQVQLEDHITLFRYRDQPGMMGRVGTLFGERGVNIGSSIIGRAPEGEAAGDGLATMVITTDAPVPAELIDAVVATDGFIAGRTVSL
jgi:D-3-phosphoglycerate dehydrogenase